MTMIYDDRLDNVTFTVFKAFRLFLKPYALVPDPTWHKRSAHLLKQTFWQSLMNCGWKSWPQMCFQRVGQALVGQNNYKLSWWKLSAKWNSHYWVKPFFARWSTLTMTFDLLTLKIISFSFCWIRQSYYEV